MQAAVTDARLRELAMHGSEVQSRLAELDAACVTSRDQEESLKEELGKAVQLKYRLLLATVSDRPPPIGSTHSHRLNPHKHCYPPHYRLTFHSSLDRPLLS